jgi:hypothetical protein
MQTIIGEHTFAYLAAVRKERRQMERGPSRGLVL